jgi:hypothetical protein
MVYINIPYMPENNRIDKDLVAKELKNLDLDNDARFNIFEAIYNRLPRGIEFAGKDADKAQQLEIVLRRLGISYRESEDSEYF